MSVRRIVEASRRGAVIAAWAFPMAACVEGDKGRGEQDSSASASVPYAVPLAGCEQHHTAPITIGGQEFNVWIDSGSGTLAVSATGCSACESEGVTALYDTDHGQVAGGIVRAEYGYETGETRWFGRVYEDSVAFAGVPSVSLKFAAVMDQGTGMFGTWWCDAVPTPIDGILGLGPRDLAHWPAEAYSSALRRDAGVPRTFAMRYCHTGGTLWFGGYDDAAILGGMAFVPLEDIIQDAVEVTAVELEAADGLSTVVSVSDDAESLPAALDSGDNYIILPVAAYDAVLAALRAVPVYAALEEQGGASEMSPSELDAALPTLVFDLTGPPAAQVRLPATASYVSWWRTSDGGYQYYGLLRSDAELPDQYSDLVVLGNSPMYSYVVYTDRENDRVGFAPAAPCEEEE